MATVQKHIHKIKKHTYRSGNETYFCVDDCSYKVTPALSLGKTVVCWRCNESFKMDDYSLRLVKPHCTSCHKSKGTTIEQARMINSDELNGIAIDFDEPAPNDLGLSLTDRLKQITNRTNNETETDENKDEL